MTEQQLTYYFEQFAAGKLSAEERAAFAASIKDPANQEIVAQILDKDWPLWQNNQLDFTEEIGRIEKGVAAAIRSEQPTRPALIRRGWFKYAAAAVILLGAAITVAISLNKQQRISGTELAQQGIGADILPGTNKAVLTVDNQQIDLSASQSGIVVDNKITYTDGQKVADAGTILTLTTPHGGQYQLTLPDGTKAWLNAASSIRFPSAFKDGERRITVKGEVYLEVAKDGARPFLVDVGGKAAVEVLGTSFNINSYADEELIKTTLVEGSIRLSVAGRGSVSAILKPGQQAALSADGSANSIQVTDHTDLSNTLAWKNGLFSFSNTSIRTVMKQLERWYDIQVRYEGRPSDDITLTGKMYRNVNLSNVLLFLQNMGVKFRLEGKTLVVL